MNTPYDPEPDPDAWQQQMSCLRFNPDYWVVNRRALTEGNLFAVALCYTCPVKRQCADMYIPTAKQGTVPTIVAGRVYGAMYRNGHRPLTTAEAERFAKYYTRKAAA